MKNALHAAVKLKASALYFLVLAGALSLVTGCRRHDPPNPVLKVTTVATGFANPIGVEVDRNGRVWVGQSGTGHNDGKVVVITKDGQKYDAIVNLESQGSEGGEPDGPSHLLFADGILYILGTNGKMYKANVSGFEPGDTPLEASTLGVEDIGAFVLAQDFENDTHESHPYNLTKGPDGAIYITDAAANAIVRRDKTGVLSILTEVPGIPNPTPVGPPTIESVPTGIIYDGENFLVTTLLGFPFPPGQALIYKVTPMGEVSVYQQGFSSLVDIAEGNSNGRLVLEHGEFGQMGFGKHTGRLVWANGTTASVLADELNLPAGLKQADRHTWYVTSIGDSSLLKVSY